MWPMIDNSYDNSNLIFPSKQKAVGKLVAECRLDPNVLKLIVFGSCVTGNCNQWSDIDVYFELENDTSIFPSTQDNTVFDKWTNYSVSKDLLDEIKSKGVLVYDRTSE